MAFAQQAHAECLPDVHFVDRRGHERALLRLRRVQVKQ